MRGSAKGVRGISAIYTNILGKDKSDDSGSTRHQLGGKVYHIIDNSKKPNWQFRVQNLKIYPQYEVVTSDYSYRLDFAFLLFENIDKDLKLSKKIGIECDGYKYHSGKVRFTADKERFRNLTSDGWTILSFSGSEINKGMFKNKEYLKEIGKIFKLLNFGNDTINKV